MAIHILSNPITQELLYRMRDPNTDNPSFRSHVKDFGTFVGYEIAAHLPTVQKTIETCMKETARHDVLDSHPSLISILRAGEPLMQGLQRTFPYAKVGFIGAMRNEDTGEASFGYYATPLKVNGNPIIVCDPMIATAGSMMGALDFINSQKPGALYIAAVTASKEGIDTLQRYNPSLEIFVGAVDPRMNDKKYILPGLGDAGDRCYGEKSQCSIN